MKKIDGKESNTAKGVRSATEFNKLFNKKVMRHGRGQLKTRKQEIGGFMI